MRSQIKRYNQIFPLISTKQLIQNPDRGEVVEVRKDRFNLNVKVRALSAVGYAFEIMDSKGEVVQFARIFDLCYQINCNNLDLGYYLFNVKYKNKLLSGFSIEIKQNKLKFLTK